MAKKDIPLFGGSGVIRDPKGMGKNDVFDFAILKSAGI